MQHVLGETQARKLYDQMASSYDFWSNLTDARAHEVGARMANVRDGESIVEIGVGTGLFFARLLGQNPHGVNVGLDQSHGMLMEAVRNLAKTAGAPRLVQGSAFALPFPDGTFDLVSAAFVMDIFPETEFVPFLSECARAARPDGRLLLVNMTTGEHWYNRMWGDFADSHPKLMGGCRAIEAAPFLAGAGWRLVEREVVVQLSFPSEVVLAKRFTSTPAV